MLLVVIVIFWSNKSLPSGAKVCCLWNRQTPAKIIFSQCISRLVEDYVHVSLWTRYLAMCGTLWVDIWKVLHSLEDYGDIVLTEAMILCFILFCFSSNSLLYIATVMDRIWLLIKCYVYHNYAKWSTRPSPTLAQVMAYYMTALSYCLHHFFLIINSKSQKCICRDNTW